MEKESHKNRQRHDIIERQRKIEKGDKWYRGREKYV